MQTLTWLIFAATYVGLGLGYWPKLRLDRAGIAVVGTALVLACGLLTMRQAAASIDYETIVLLFAMMMVVGFLKFAGFFRLLTTQIDRRLTSPHALLIAVIGLSGVLSAILVNDVVCMALTPLVLNLCERGRRPVKPYLISVATAANIGSVATITGNPQNIIIGSLSHLSYATFAAYLTPIAVVGLVINYVMIAVIYRRELSQQPSGHRAERSSSQADPHPDRGIHKGLLIKSLLVTCAAILGFFVCSSMAEVAFVAASFLLLSRIRPEKIYQEVDWPLLMMFAGLFIIVRAFELHVVRGWGIEHWTALRESPVVMVSGLSVVLSNLVSNVPAVLLFKPVMAVMQDAKLAWLALAMSSTLAGNLTILGSVANLIVVESCRRRGTTIGFVEYLKVGVPLTTVTTAVGMGYLLWLQHSGMGF